MSRYTYTLHTEKESKSQLATTYSMTQLQAMTTFQLKEICQKEKLAAALIDLRNREEIIRQIMRFRGKSEYRHMHTQCEGGLERLSEFFNHTTIEPMKECLFEVPGKLLLYQGLGVDVLDGYEFKSNLPLFEGNVLLADENNQIYTCFYLKEQEGCYYLMKGKEVAVAPLEGHPFSLLYLDEKSSEFLYDLYYDKNSTSPNRIRCFRIPLLNVEIKPVVQTNLPLVIDFGTSNTTVGMCCKDGSNQIVKINGKACIPSVIGVKGGKACAFEFVFGEEARKQGNQNYLDQEVPLFYHMKQWIGDMEQEETVILTDGSSTQISRKTLLQSFFLYLIDLAEQQFKYTFESLQILVPSWQKERFETLFQDLLSNYQVDCSLDEGTAALFYSIHQLIQEGRYEKNRQYQALLLDSGGGTTDLISGKFSINVNRVSYQIHLETCYENGTVNVAGNYLTFRIFQLLKIKIAEQVGFLKNWDGSVKEETWKEEAWKEETVSEKTRMKWSEKVELAYQEVEGKLPTKFQWYENKDRQQYFKVKNNYYYLFLLAEKVKEILFGTAYCYELWLDTKQGERKEVLFLDPWKLSVRNGSNLEPLRQEIRFPIYRHEIENLWKPDIYELMEQFLEKMFESGELQEYSMIKLTGQSCRLELFTEALKQFVPGRLIQTARQEEEKEEQKLCCLKGALAYLLSSKLGYMEVNHPNCFVMLPYEIMAWTHENKKKVLIRSLEQRDSIGFISRFKIGQQLDLYLTDERGNTLKTYYFESNRKEFTKTTQDQMETEYQETVIQEETDIILEGETKFFVWAARKSWGFLVLPVMREEGFLYKGKETFFPFEDSTWETHFFDGRK